MAEYIIDLRDESPLKSVSRENKNYVKLWILDVNWMLFVMLWFWHFAVEWFGEDWALFQAGIEPSYYQNSWLRRKCRQKTAKSNSFFFNRPITCSLKLQENYLRIKQKIQYLIDFYFSMTFLLGKIILTHLKPYACRFTVLWKKAM